MPDYFIDHEGYVVDGRGQYVLDEDGDLITEDELSDPEDEFVQAMQASYSKLESMLGREPTDTELVKLLEAAEQTGDPQIDQSYERVLNRPANSDALNDDETRIRVMAEYAQEADEADEGED